MRILFFISMLFALGYVAYLQMSQVKEHDLDKAETQIDQSREQINKAIEQHQQRLQQIKNNE